MDEKEPDWHRYINDALNRAFENKGDLRAMCVTLECGHLRLMASIHCIQGVGSKTACFICPELGLLKEGQTQVVREVVKIEETGELIKDWWEQMKTSPRMLREADRRITMVKIGVHAPAWGLPNG